MQVPQRYPELFLAPPERTPESFWISLGYFNLYRLTVAALFLTLSFIYEDALNLGSHSLGLFRYTCAGYLILAISFQVALRRVRELFNVQLSLQACADVLVLDREGRVVQHNPQAPVLLRADKLLGADIEALLPEFSERWRSWRAGGAAAGSAADLAVRGRDIGLRLLDTGTEEGFSVLFVEDTTRAREQAQQLKLAALGRLTANIAHEIRNPLAAISHASELLAEQKGDDPGRLTRIIQDNTQRLERLVSDVLQLNRRDRMSADPIRLHPWLREFLAEFVANESAAAPRFAVEASAGTCVEI